MARLDRSEFLRRFADLRFMAKPGRIAYNRIALRFTVPRRPAFFMALKRPTPLHDEEVRTELIARVRRQLHDGTYESGEKLEFALTRLFLATGISHEIDVRGLHFGPPAP